MISVNGYLFVYISTMDDNLFQYGLVGVKRQQKIQLFLDGLVYITFMVVAEEIERNVVPKLKGWKDENRRGMLWTVLVDMETH